MQTQTNISDAPASRGDVARDRLIAVAARLFASRGYDGVSVRELAKAADVNVASVSYYFGGKRGLYLAALESLMEQMRPIGGPVIETIEKTFDDRTPARAELAALTAFVVRHILTTMLSGDIPPWVCQTVLREMQEPTEDYRPMFDDRVLPLRRAVRRLVAAAINSPFDAPRAILASHAFLGQVMSFAAVQRVVLEELNWPDFAGEHLDPVIQTATGAALGALGLEPEEAR